MKSGKQAGLEFVVDSNVHIEVMSPQNVITQTVDNHNKATQSMVEGLLRFIRGEFNTSYARTNENLILYKNDAKKYIPCFIGVGTGGILIDPATHLPAYDPNSRRKPPMELDVETGKSWWDADDNYVKFTDTKLYLEAVTKSRVQIGVLGEDETTDNISQVGDIKQIVFHTEVSPGYYSEIYDTEPSDIFITEIGLFASSECDKKDLLARVILKNLPEEDKTQILYVRPQDTIILRWTISIIALDDCSFTDEETAVELDSGNINVPVGTSITDEVPYDGGIEFDDGSDPPEMFVTALKAIVERKTDGTIILPEGIECIGEYAFDHWLAYQGTSNLISISIPSTVQYIDTHAFMDCQKLETVTMKAGITEIREQAFIYCYKLESINLPDTITTIGSSAFDYCSVLNNITLPAGLTEIASYCFHNCIALSVITFPETLTTINSNAFEGCKALTTITFPDTLTTINSNAFQNCSYLTSVTLPHVTRIGQRAFMSCTRLVTLDLGDSLTQIDSEAFYNCTGLTTVRIPSTITIMNGYAFNFCTGIRDIYIDLPSTQTQITVPSNKWGATNATIHWNDE